MAVELNIEARLNGIESSIKSVNELAKVASDSAEKIAKEFKKTSDSVSTFGGGIGKAALAFTALNQGLELLGKIASAFTAPIRSAEEAENGINALNTALALSGNYSEDASKGFEEFAASIQKTTTVSDDAVISAGALIEQITQLGEKDLETATKAAIDLSSALGIDLDTAARRVSLAIEGNTSAFKKYGIEIEEGQNKAEKFSNAIEAFNRFNNAAEAQTNTFGGALKRLGNVFDDVLETIGNVVVKNGQLIKIINAASEVISSNSGLVEDLASVFSDILSGAIQLAVNGFILFLKTLKAIDDGVSALLDTISPLTSKLSDLYSGLRDISKLAFDKLNSLDPTPVRDLASNVQTVTKEKTRLDNIIAGVTSFSDILSKTSKSDVGKKISDQFGLISQGAKDAKRDIEKEIPEALLKMIEKFKNAGLSRIEVIQKEKDKQLELAQSFADNDLSLTTEVEALKKSIRIDAIQKIADETNRIQEEQRTKELKEIERQKDRIKTLTSGSVIEVLTELNVGGKLDDAIDYAAIGANLIGAIKEGAKGAEKLVTGVLGAIGDAIVPGIGPIVSQIADVLAQGPEQVEKMVTEFVSAIGTVITNIIQAAPVFISTLIREVPKLIASLIAALPSLIAAIVQSIPTIIQAIVESVPTIVQAFVDNLPLIITAIIDAVPAIIEAIIEGVPAIITSVIESIPKIITALVDAVPLIITKLAEDAPRIITSLVSQTPKIAISLIKSLVKGSADIIKSLVLSAPEVIWAMIKEIPNLVTEMAKAFWQAIKDVVGGVGDIAKSAGNAIWEGIKFIVPGLAHGGTGIVPPGFGNDSFRANLTSGEMVIDRTDNMRLSDFLNQQESNESIASKLDKLIAVQGNSSGRPLSINLKIGEKELADVILNLNRQGFRTA